MNLPPVVLSALAGLALVVLGACAATIYLVVRAPMRARIACWPLSRVLTLIVVAELPWLVVQYAPIEIVVRANGIVQLVGWLLLALLAFALLVLLPLAAVASAGLWWWARGARATRDSAR